MKIFAHRGASGEFPENTLEAFQQAINQQTDGIELDVFEVDGEFYIWHDRYLPPHTEIDLPLWQLTAEQIRQFGDSAGQQIATLSEALRLISGQCVVNIEIKYLTDVIKLSQLLHFSIDNLGFDRTQLLISSFDHLLLKSLRQLNPDYLLGALLASAPLSLNDIIAEIQPFSLHLDINCLREETVKMAHQENLECYVYTVDREQDIAMVKRFGADGIFTNFPAHTKNFADILK